MLTSEELQIFWCFCFIFNLGDCYLSLTYYPTVFLFSFFLKLKFDSCMKEHLFMLIKNIYSNVTLLYTSFVLFLQLNCAVKIKSVNIIHAENQSCCTAQVWKKSWTIFFFGFCQSAHILQFNTVPGCSRVRSGFSFANRIKEEKKHHHTSKSWLIIFRHTHKKQSLHTNWRLGSGHFHMYCMYCRR